MSNRRELAAPGVSSILARSGYDLLVFPEEEYDRRTTHSSGSLAVVHGNRIEEKEGVWSIEDTEPRAALCGDEPIIVISGESPSGGYGTKPLYAMGLGDLIAGRGESSAITLPKGLHSPMVVDDGIEWIATGYTYDEDSTAVTMSPGSGREQALNLAIYNVGSSKPVMMAMIQDFTEQAENNLVSAVTPDGVIHLIATEVIVGHGNSSKVHHLRFDPVRRKWLGDDVLFVRNEFTSMNTPRLAGSGSALDAFWLPVGDHRLSSDGLYAHRIGEAVAWRLTDGNGEYAVLPDADGQGALLVGVAIHPSRDGRIDWFLHRGGEWSTAGSTDLGTRAYTMRTEGTEPFALWRDSPAGTIHAAFLSEGKLLVVDLTLAD